jgi:hypothetical protein
MAAVLAGRDMPAERRGAAALEVAGIGSTPGSAMGAEDIRDLQPFPGHEIPDQAGGRGPCLRYSKGLLTAFKVVLAMWL